MKVLLLGDEGYLALKVLYCLHATGAYVETAGSSGSDIIKYSRYSKHHTQINFWSDEIIIPETQDWLCQYIEAKSFDIVVPSDMDSAAFLASTKNICGHKIKFFPCSKAEILDTLHNKWTFSRTCMKHGIPIPATILLESYKQLEENLFDEVGFPLIVKPLEKSGCDGVVRLNSYKDLLDYVQGNSIYSHFPLIAQSFIPGRDIDINVLAVNGKILCSSVQSWVDKNNLEFSSNTDMYNLAAKIIQESNYDGLAHFDMRIDTHTNKLYVIECNPRAWNTIAASMWQGTNFIAEGISYILDGFISSEEEHYAKGRHCLSGSFLKQIFSPFSGWQNISAGSARAFLQIMLDPIPNILNIKSKLSERDGAKEGKLS